MVNGLIIRKSDFQIDSLRGHHIVMHISDSHLCLTDEFSSEEEKERSGKREADWAKGKLYFAGLFGDKVDETNNVTTVEALDRVFEYAKEIRPELLIMSGDTLEYMHEAGMKYLKKKISEYGGPFLIVPGNHEGPVFEGLWDKKPGVYRGEGFTFVGLDNRKKTVSEDTLSTLRELVSEETALFPVYHVPVATDANREEMKVFESYYVLDENTEDENGRQFVKILKDSENIKAAFCGHVHGFKRSDIVKGKPQICAASSMIENVHLIDIHG